MELDVSKKYGLNIIAIKKNGVLTPAPGPNYVFSTEDHLVVVGIPADIYKITKKI